MITKKVTSVLWACTRSRSAIGSRSGSGADGGGGTTQGFLWNGPRTLAQGGIEIAFRGDWVERTRTIQVGLGGVQSAVHTGNGLPRTDWVRIARLARTLAFTGVGAGGAGWRSSTGGGLAESATTKKNTKEEY